MIPIRLNLLSPEKRRAHRRAIYVQFTKNILEIFLIMLCLSTMALIAGLRAVENQIQDIGSARLVADSAFEKTNRDVDAVNASLRRIERVQDAYIFWLPILSGVSNAIPRDIQLDTLSLDVSGRTIGVAGHAKTRETLLALQKSLKSIPWVQPFDLPVEQLTQKENVAFSLRIKMKE